MFLYRSRKKIIQDLNEKASSEAVIRTPAEQAWRRFRKNKMAMIGAGMLIFLLLFVFVGSAVSKYNPDMIDLM